MSREEESTKDGAVPGASHNAVFTIPQAKGTRRGMRHQYLQRKSHRVHFLEKGGYLLGQPQMTQKGMR